MGDPLEDLAKELSEYVALRRRQGADNFAMEDALIGHRRQAIENLRDTQGELFWIERVKLLDRLAEKRGIPLANEEALRYVEDELREKERRRRAEVVAAHREGVA
ncbi:MAG: hypothetical protein M3P18_13700 [Actinomycetota bacterium]|nr:hypothetical protein [Actinomycetota bacterium]